jgi:hypothetical protein
MSFYAQLLIRYRMHAISLEGISRAILQTLIVTQFEMTIPQEVHCKLWAIFLPGLLEESK